MDFILSAGQAADCKYAIPLIESKKYQLLLADKGYDSDAILDHVKKADAMAIIPPKRNRKIQRDYDKEIYKERHKVECLFGFLKHYRRIFSRFDKIASRFQAFLHFAAAIIWMR